MSSVGGASSSNSSSGASSSNSASESDSDSSVSSSSGGDSGSSVDAIADSQTSEEKLSSGQTTEERLGGTAANDDTNEADSNTPNTSTDTDTKLEDVGINVNQTTNPVPAGSVGKTPGVTPGSVTTQNGNLARDQIANRATAQGLTANTEVHFDANFNRMPAGSANTAGSRFVDVEVERPHPTDPRLNQVEHIESKAMRVNAGSIGDAQLAHDAGMLSNNRAIRAGGVALENAGKIARPVGMVIDAVSVVGAIKQDGGIGEETGRTITGIAGGAAGGFAGAKAGAALGAAVGSVIPGAGTAAGAVVGGVIGGIAGAIGGENIAKDAFNAVKGWFS